MKTQMLNVISVIFILLISISCGKNEKIEKIESNLIISKLINDYAKPVPPPLKHNDSVSSIDFDSIQRHLLKKWKNKKMVVCLDTINTPKIDKVINDAETNILVENLGKLKNDQTINTSKLDIVKNIEFCKVYNKAHQKYNEIDMVLSFSRVSFNKNFEKAVVVIGISRGKLSGHSSLLVLQKIEGKWNVIDSKLLEIN